MGINFVNLQITAILLANSRFSHCINMHFCAIWHFVILFCFPFQFHKDIIQKRVCRNARCTFFFVHPYTNWFIFFKLRFFEDFFDLCVPGI